MSPLDGRASPEEMRKIELMDRLANWILDAKMDDYAENLLELYGRFEILGQTLYFDLAPIMTVIYGQDGALLSEMLALDPREGSALLLKRIKIIKAEREKERLLHRDEDEEIPLRLRIKVWFLKMLSRLLG